MEDSGTEIYCHPAQDRVVVNEIGVYFVHYHADLLNMGDASPVVLVSSHQVVG
jgi:hypothetical protein